MKNKYLYGLLCSDILIFAILMAIGSLLSVYIKNENVFDLLNYHYYNGFAFWENRIDYDFFPGYANTLLNPLPELPLYFFIRYFNDFPNIFYALQGIWYGLSLVMLYKIATLYFDVQKIEGMGSVVLVLIVATLSKSIWIQIGSSTNEIMMLFFALSGMYILLKMIKFPDTQSFGKFLAAGIILGAGLGLKQTALVFCVASGFMLIACYKYLKKPFKYIFMFAFGGFLGVLLTDGWWMYKLWQAYDNPFFPYVNNIFRSDWAEAISHRDTRNIRNWSVFYPYVWPFSGAILAAGSFTDYVLIFGYTIMIGTLFYLIVTKKIKGFYENNRLDFSLLIFLLIFYFLWYYIYTCYRYICIFSALLPIFCLKMMSYWQSKYNVFGYAFLIVLLCQNPFRHTGTNYRGNIEKVAEVEELTLPDNTIIHVYGEITSGILPEIARKNKFRAVAHNKKCINPNGCGIIGRDADFFEYGRLAKRRSDMIRQHRFNTVIYLYNRTYFPYLHKNTTAASNKLISYLYLRGNVDKSVYDENRWIAQEYTLNYDKGLIKKLRLQYYCRELRHNFDTEDYQIPLYICVPKALKNQILKNTQIDDENAYEIDNILEYIDESITNREIDFFVPSKISK